MSVLVVVFFVATTVAQNVLMQDMFNDGKQKVQPSFLVRTTWAVTIINEGTAFGQCKHLADLITKGNTFNQEIFDNALPQMDATLPEVQAFKTWGEYCATIPPSATDSDYAPVSMESHKAFWDQTMAYELIKNSLETNGFFVAQLNGMRIITIKDAQFDCAVLAGEDKDWKYIGYYAAPGYYMVKMLPDYYSIKTTSPK
ncbi:MAG: hypothetical protein WCG25_07665 [bacterium]